MAAAKYTYKKVRHGVKCTAKITLACGHKLEEFAVGRDEGSAYKVCKRLLEERTEYHTRNDCDKKG